MSNSNVTTQKASKADSKEGSNSSTQEELASALAKALEQVERLTTEISVLKASAALASTKSLSLNQKLGRLAEELLTEDNKGQESLDNALKEGEAKIKVTLNTKGIITQNQKIEAASSDNPKLAAQLAVSAYTRTFASTLINFREECKAKANAAATAAKKRSSK